MSVVRVSRRLNLDVELVGSFVVDLSSLRYSS